MNSSVELRDLCLKSESATPLVGAGRVRGPQKTSSSHIESFWRIFGYVLPLLPFWPGFVFWVDF